MANLSQLRRQRILAFLEKMRSEHKNDDEVLSAINEVETEMNEKKYGLVWEEHSEDVEERMVNEIPIFVEDKNKKISATEDTYNFLLEGDNLHSLHLLEKTHKEKVNIIYIDPPYNTGKEFTYDDKIVGQDDGFRHSKWLSFMAVRLRLAKNLLAQDGILLLSIDDNEEAQLKILCDSIFGEEAFLSILPRRTINSGKHDSKTITTSHDYVLIYSNNATMQFKQKEKLTDEKNSLYSKTDEYIKTRGRHYITQLNKNSLQYSDALNYPIIAPDGSEIWAGGGFDDKQWIWRWSKEKLEWGIKNGFIVFKKPAHSQKYKVYTKSYEFVDKDGNPVTRTNPNTSLDYCGNEYTNFNATPELERIMGVKKSFDYPKPKLLIKSLLALYPNKNAFILDFFAGSGTTGQAVLELNQEDGGNRHFILCTNNENGICENVTYPRIKTVISGIRPDGTKYSDGIPANLKYYKTDFISKKSTTLSDDLITHVDEMIQREHGVQIDHEKYISILTDEDADDLEKQWDKREKAIKAIYISRHVLLTGKQKELFDSKDFYVIPDYYFRDELRETGEA